MSDWFDTFFDRGYLERYPPDERGAEREVDGVLSILGVQPPARVLDLACGYGRHAVELARRGFDVVGYDLSQQLLAEAETRARGAGVSLGLLEGDMRRLPFFREFDVVLSLFTSFGFFSDDEDDRRVVGGVFASLREGGRFLVDVVNRDMILRDFHPTMWQEMPAGLLLSESTYDPLTSRMEGRQVFVRPDGRRLEYPLSLRLYAAHELAGLLRDAGLVVDGVFGDLSGAAFVVDSPRVVVVGRRVVGAGGEER